MHPTSEQLASTFINTFWSADQEIEWEAVEEERQLWLSDNTLLVGRVDARGLSWGERFFGEWKTISPYRARYMTDEKAKWRTDPQALTYGVLVPECKRFVVRWAVKPDSRRGPWCDFEWYTYTEGEVEHWRQQLLKVAQEIRTARTTSSGGPWLTNFGSCYRWGVKYACPFITQCTNQRFGESLGKPRTPHLQIERSILERGVETDVVILDASRVGDYLECPEKYRRLWEGEGYQDTGEALTIGTDFHSLIASHIRGIMEERAQARTN